MGPVNTQLMLVVTNLFLIDDRVFDCMGPQKVVFYDKWSITGIRQMYECIEIYTQAPAKVVSHQRLVS